MRKTILRTAAVALIGLCTGCLAVSATETNRIEPNKSEVVSVNGHVYIVDKGTGHVREVDLASAKPYKPQPGEDITPKASDCDEK